MQDSEVKDTNMDEVKQSTREYKEIPPRAWMILLCVVEE
jgi:hypothetical protein